ncbi:condensation domain-containing protein [Streptomyces sp. NPDC003697]
MRETEGSIRYPLSAQLTSCCISEPGGKDMAKFVMPMALRIRGSVDSAALQGALDDVVARHESLRTVMTCGCGDGDAGYQTVLQPAPVPFTEHQLGAGPGKSRDEVAEELLTTLYAETMSRFATPLVRAALYRFDDRDAVLTILSHHLAGDAWSTHLLRRDLAAFYRARTAGTAPELPPVRQYGEYALWQQERLSGAKAGTDREYWAGRLAGSQVFALPADHPDGVVGAGGAPYGSATFDLGPQEMSEVRARARGERCSTWHVLAAAGAMLAARISGETDVTLMTLRAPRDNPAFQDTVGIFVDTLPLRIDLGGCRTFRDVLLRARSTCLEAYRHALPSCILGQEVPDFMEPFGKAENMPTFFNYSAHKPANEEIQFADGVDRVAFRQEMPLERGGWCVWGMWELPSGGLRSQLEYSPDRLEAGTADRWINDFRDLVLRITHTPDQTWKDN